MMTYIRTTQQIPAMPIVFMLMAVYIIVTAIPMESEGVFPIMSAGVLLLCAVY